MSPCSWPNGTGDRLLAARWPAAGLLVRRASNGIIVDVVTDQPVNVSPAFILAPPVTPCCVPGLLPLRRDEDAVRCQAGFGEPLAVFKEAVVWLVRTGLAKAAP